MWIYTLDLNSYMLRANFNIIYLGIWTSFYMSIVHVFSRVYLGSTQMNLNCSFNEGLITAGHFFFLPPLSLIVSCRRSWPTCFSFFDVTPVCATGGQLDQRGAECRRSAGGSLQRSHHGSGRGGGGRRGEVGVTQSPHHSSLSICRFLSSPLFLSLPLCLSHYLLCCETVKPLPKTQPSPPSCHPASALLIFCLLV